MTDRQLTDSEIIKALDCCKYDDCNNCPNVVDNCHANLIDYALDLINRQKEEIKRSNALIICKNKIIEGLDKSIEYAYNKGVQEFAELLKNDWIGNLYYCEDLDITDWIDNLLKEMVGDSDEQRKSV